MRQTTLRREWPSPVDDHKVGMLALTEETLFVARAVDPETVARLGNEAGDEEVRSAIRGKLHAFRRAEITSVERVRGRARLLVRSKIRNGAIDFRAGDEEGAAALFESLTSALGLRLVGDVRARGFLTWGNPVSALLLLLLTGSYAAFFLPDDFMGRGRPFAMAGAVTGMMAILLWLGYRIMHPVRVLEAARVGMVPPRIADEEVRNEVARSLQVDSGRLTPETHFHHDLKVPPGEVEEALQVLEERWGRSLRVGRIDTFGDLLAAVGSGLPEGVTGPETDTEATEIDLE